jgi:hypothetical protein
MDIPTLSILRKDIKQKALKKERDSIDKIIQKRKMNRNNWEPDRIKEYEDDLIELKKSNDIFIEEMTNLIIEKTNFVLNQNSNAKGFKLIEPHMYKLKYGKFNGSQIYKGFYNYDKNTFCRLKHYEADINETPFIHLKNKFEKYGYLLYEYVADDGVVSVMVDFS